MRKIFYSIILLSVIAISSCKKEKATPGKDTPTKDGSTLDLIKDSVYLYAKETYYWNDAIPDYKTFNPRSYTGSNDLAALESEVDAISQIKKNPTTGLPFEYYAAAPGHAKYSFIDDGSVSSELNGIKGDFGFAPIYIGVNDLRVRYVYPGSPSDLAGLKRGYQITAINGRTNLSYDADNGGAGTNVNFVINAYSNSSTITMTVKRSDGSTFDANLNVASYTLNPVLKYQVYDQGSNHKVGYLVFNSFTSDANAKPKLDEAFNQFVSQGITDLVVDLRYNGGGFVSTAKYLTNLIAPASANGSTMYTEFYNANMQRNDIPLLKSIYSIPDNYFAPTYPENFANFAKAGNLNINRVFFIVSGSTASASELVINNLRAVMDVQLIGNTTYGKPVGFFALDINKYQLYVAQFETKNGKGQGGYYAGMTPSSPSQVTEYPGFKDGDDVSKDFGDPTERLLAHALNYVKTGSFNSTTQQTQSLSKSTFTIDQSRDAGFALDKGRFNGMIFNKVLKPKK